MHHALLFCITICFGKLRHLSPPTAFSVPTGWFSPQQDTLTCFLCLVWQRAHAWAKKQMYLPSLLLLDRSARGSHNTPDYLDVSLGDAILEKPSYLHGQQLVMHIWRWKAIQVLPRLQEKSAFWISSACLAFLIFPNHKETTMLLGKIV